MFDKTMLVGGELRYLLRKRKTIANPEETVINLFEKSYDLMNLEDGINSEVFKIFPVDFLLLGININLIVLLHILLLI
ncbi:hypothetical protein HOL88_03130 [archaeon]|nr:hypothetical protein [archaeon]